MYFIIKTLVNNCMQPSLLKSFFLIIDKVSRHSMQSNLLNWSMFMIMKHYQCKILLGQPSLVKFMFIIENEHQYQSARSSYTNPLPQCLSERNLEIGKMYFMSIMQPSLSKWIFIVKRVSRVSWKYVYQTEFK